MTQDDSTADTRDGATDWVVPPPAPGTAGFAFRPGEGFALSEEGAEALQTLAAELGEQDAAGFMIWMQVCSPGA